MIAVVPIATQRAILVTSWAFARYSYLDTYRFSTPFLFAAVVHMLTMTLGWRWLVCARMPMFGLSAVVIIPLVQPMGLLPNIHWSGILAPIPVVPFTAWASALSGAMGGRWITHLSGDMNDAGAD